MVSFQPEKSKQSEAEVVPKYGGVPPSRTTHQYQYPQYHEVIPTPVGDNQDQGWRLPQFKRKEANTMAYHANNIINTQTSWTRTDQQERWRNMGAPLAQSIGPQSHDLS